jgi:hypothetical protein
VVGGLPALLAVILQELETSTDPSKVALIRRLREGTYTLRDTSDVADMIEALVERAVKVGRHN